MKQVLPLILLTALPALADIPQPPPATVELPRFEPTGVTNETLDRYVRSMVDEVGGRPGMWEFVYLDVAMVMVTDEPAGRMRIMSPVIEAAGLTDADRTRILEANFNSALDARYALWNDVLWAVFIHPMEGMSRPAFEDAVRQVATLRRNYGTSYSSTEMQFAVEPAEGG